jgi:pyruvate dehydrogenase E2 component (dihydrolipoamide acetyltransferase)
MAKPIKMPELGESITEGTITRWLKQEGDQVQVDEPLFEVSTDKVDTEVPSPVAGVLKTIKVREDETVAVGTELAEIEPAGADSSAEGDGQAPAAEAEALEAERETPAAEAEAPEAEAPEGEGEAPDAEAPEAGAETGDEGSGGAETVTVRMPELGESIGEGTITRWLKQEGDQVQADEPLFEVSTDKVDTEVPSPVAGVVKRIRVAQDETVDVGAELVEIATGAKPEAEKPKAEKPKAEKPEAEEPKGEKPEAEEPKGEKPEAEAPKETAGDGGGRGVPEGTVVSPLVRRLAREHDIDLSRIRGSGAGGRVRREDVEAYLEQGGEQPAAASAGTPSETSQMSQTSQTSQTREAPAAETAKAAAPTERRQAAQREATAGSPGLQVAVPLPTGVREEVVKATRTRRLIAERMVTSLQVSAQLTTAVEVDMTRVMRLREQAKEAFKQREGVSLSPLPFCVEAMISAVKQYPIVNSAMDADGNLHIYKDVNLGVAVDTPKGLFVPVIKHADSLNLAGLAKAIADVATRTRDGKIGPDELSGSTITVTNTGSRGAVFDTPIINQPNAALFATPAIIRRPAVVDDPDLGEVLAVRHMMYAILTYDHRIIDGADAARFLVKVKEVLEEGDFSADLDGI